MCHELLTQRALFVLESMQKGHAESAFHGTCCTSSDYHLMQLKPSGTSVGEKLELGGRGNIHIGACCHVHSKPACITQLT